MIHITNFIKSGIILTISTLMIRTISILFNIYLSNTISVSTLGIFGILMSVLGFFLSISMSGINLSATRLTSEEKAFGSIENIPHLIQDCFKYCIVFCALSISLILIFSNYILTKILGNTIPRYSILLIILAIPFCSLSSCLNGYFMGIDKIKPLIISQILETIIQIFITISLIKLNYISNNNICILLIISMLISEIISYFYLKHAYKKTLKQLKNTKTFHSKYILKIYKISLPVAITTYIKTGLSTIKNSLIPISFIAYGLTYNESLSIYGLISNTIMTFLLFPFTFIQAYCSLLIPKISSLKVHNKKNNIKNVIKKSLALTFIFSILSASILIIGADYINKYIYPTLTISPYLKLLAPIIIYIYLDNIIDNILKSLNLQIYVMLINILDLIISIIFIKYFIPIYGINGYIFILYFSEIFNFTLSLLVLKRKEYDKIALQNKI